MTDDIPKIGLVIRHMYLWRDEHKQGREEGLKARPCLIVHIRQNEYDETEVFICPITHTPQQNSVFAKEIPHKTKQRLKLDDDRSWVITSEVNRFIWKGPDIRKTQSGKNAYGFLPHGLVTDIVDQFRENARSRAVGVVDREDETLTRKRREPRAKTESKFKGRKR